MGSLPFKDRAQVVHGAGNVTLDELACSLWPLPAPRTNAGGETYDWTGEAQRDAAVELAQPNRTIVDAEGRYLKVVAAVPQDFIPLVALQLRETKAGG